MNNNPPLVAIVDDDPDVRRALRRLVGSAGFAVETFGSGTEFLQSLDSHEPACVVLDLHMPEVSGFEVQSQVAQTHARVRVVILTGHDTPESRARSFSGGATAYLCKPVDEEVLLAAINAAISHRITGDA